VSCCAVAASLAWIVLAPAAAYPAGPAAEPSSSLVVRRLERLGAAARAATTEAERGAAIRQAVQSAEHLPPGARERALVQLADALPASAQADLWSGATDAWRDDPVAVAWILEQDGMASVKRSEVGRAAITLVRSMLARRGLAADSLDVAGSCFSLGNLADEKGDLEQAATWFRRSLTIRDRLAPGSLEVAASLNNLGIAAARRGNLDEAERRLAVAHAVRARLAPDSLVLAAGANNLGVIEDARGNLATAETWYRRGLEASERIDPGGLPVAAVYNNLGRIARSRGNLAAAEAWLKKAIAIKERLAPDSMSVAQSYDDLGLVLLERKDHEAAVEWFSKALAIRQRIAPDGLPVASSYNNLGMAALDRKDLDAAEGWFSRSLVVFERLAPDGLDVAATLNNLGMVAADRPDRDAAAAYFSRALAIKRRLTPDSLTVAGTSNNLGHLLAQQGELDEAEELLESGLEIRQRLAPDSAAVAASLWYLGEVARMRGDHERALAMLERGVAALEAQQTRIGGSPDDIATFREFYLGLYLELVDLLVELNRPAPAVRVMESARARALLALLAERDLVDRDLPPELALEMRAAAAEHRRLMAAIERAVSEEAREQALGALERMHLRQEEIRADIRRAAPRAEELRYPEPLQVEGIQALLEEDTLILAWMLGADGGVLFAIAANELAAYRLEIGETDVRSLVRQVRLSIEAMRDPAEPLDRLSAALLDPAAASIGRSNRLILLPDGPLWLLPVALLRDRGEPARPLIERHPLSVVASATVLGQLIAERRQRPVSVVAMGDPVYPRAAVAGTRGAHPLARLPSTRDEVLALQRLFGESCTVYLGADATEERARELGRSQGAGPSIVHFAAHAVVDERFALESAVALSMVEGFDPTDPASGEDGLLQAWEIFEAVRLDADLVVLSACETALGKEVAGEGLIGLTRAFHYAGARSVLASLWSVGDRSTADLMARFATGLRDGLAKDEALRQAQLELLSGPGSGSDHSHPFYWAAFQLYGDWK